jgi:hypothetical protein
MFVVVAEHFLSDIIDDYGPHPASTDGGSWNQVKYANS